MDAYTEDFAERGRSYDLAMQRWPQVRAAEFAQVIAAANLHSGMTLADVPAGGGYLANFLPPGIRYLPHEPCLSFNLSHAEAAVQSAPSVLPLPYQSQGVDRVISLAGVHHYDHKCTFHKEVHRVLQPQGLYVLSDVAEGSKVAAFLDNFVGQHNGTGHEGHYLGDNLAAELYTAGFTIKSDFRERFIWKATSVEQLAEFCLNLFGLKQLSVPEMEVALSQYLGLVNLADGVGLKWELRTVVSQPGAT